MIITSDELVRDLRDIEWLIAALSFPRDVDKEDLQDLRWLRARRKYLAAILKARRAQRGKKIVSLDLWRQGRATPVRRVA